MAIAIVLLVTPAAYHRIVYKGAEVAAFYRTASRLLLMATVFLALGLAADVDVVIRRTTQHQAFANTTGHRDRANSCRLLARLAALGAYTQEQRTTKALGVSVVEK
ncbi:hypothetical protein ASE04_18890 [Rhizobium sp. Root708]|nr:hypothetical protein ASE04_18890 [Rhizobium sp. Root708]